MTEYSKKQGFLGHVARLFTRAPGDPYQNIHFQEPELAGEESWPAIEAPATWSSEATALLAQAACNSTPGRLSAVEENTVPSWLWRHVGEASPHTAEFSARHIFDRVVGAAAYNGWKQSLFADESEARAFFDEARNMLMQRFIAIEPAQFSTLGLTWAYGLSDEAFSTDMEAVATGIDIQNTTIDSIVRGVADKTVRGKWQKIWSARTEKFPITIKLMDIASDWGTSRTSSPMRVVINLMAFRHNDGWINIEALRHAVRLTVILLDLNNQNNDPRLNIGFCNLAPLLMALALPYDSPNARSIASAISAIITAEAYATSAELAGLRGADAEYLEERETVGRILRNHRRAAYGDRNDYEKVSVLPVPLTLEHSPDLALVAGAQRRWEDALTLVRQNGLRHTQVTTLTPSIHLMMFMETSAQGVMPAASLMRIVPAPGGLFRQEVDPAIGEALTRLGYDQLSIRNILRHVAGARSLEKAPAINHVALRKHGFDEAALQRIEDYLPNVHNIRFAFTPWILGEEFCRLTLKISESKLKNVRFDLLNHLGFSVSDIAAANAFCYGQGTMRGAKDFRQVHAPIFVCGDDTTSEARIRMAAAVQGFISGDAGLSVSLVSGSITDKGEALLLSAWRQGVKSVTVTYSVTTPTAKPKVEISAAQATQEKKKASEKIKRSAFIHAKRAGELPKRNLRLKAGSELVSLGRSKVKPSGPSKGKRS